MKKRKYYSLREELSYYKDWVKEIAAKAKVNPGKVRRMFEGLVWDDKIYREALKYRNKQRARIMKSIQQNFK